MTESLKRQDASGEMPIAVCHRGNVLASVPVHLQQAFGADARPAPPLRDFIARVARLHRLGPDDVELLVLCYRHPKSSAVDCLDCEPVDQA